MQKSILRELGKAALYVLKWMVITSAIFFGFVFGYYANIEYNNIKALQQELIRENGVLIDITRDIHNKYTELFIKDMNIYKEIVILREDLFKSTKKSSEGFKATNISFDLIQSIIQKLETKTDKLAFFVNEKIKDIDKKPSYDYLKSVTVFIYGEREEQEVTEGRLVEVQLGWSGTGIIVKTEEKKPEVCIALADYECPKITTTYILTNKHVAGGGEKSKLFIKENNRYITAEIIKLHNTLDLALLKVSGRKLKNKRAIKGLTIAHPQDKIYLVGHHLGREYVYGEGVFAGYDRIYDIIQIPVLYGNSGSGVFNQDGKLVSLIFAISRVGLFDVDCAHGIAIGGLSIAAFLEDIL